MDIILLMIIAGSLIGVGKVIQEMKNKKQEKAELKERLGDEYEEFVKMRNDKRKR
jgi:hypothetical protein